MTAKGLLLPDAAAIHGFDAVRFFAQHFLHLQCDVIVPKMKPQPWGFGGPLVEVDGEWFLLTAGHCLEEVSKYKNAGYILRHWHLDDAAGMYAKSNQIGEFNFEDAVKGSSVHLDMGIDLGMVHIQPQYRGPASHNGISPLTCDAWPTRRRQFDRFFALGIPQESIQNGSQPPILEKGIRLFELEPLSPQEVPDDLKRPIPLQFFRITSGIDDVQPQIDSIKGISGGPVFAVKDVNGQAHYWLIGIQVSWLRSQRLLTAFPVNKVNKVLRHVVAELHQSAE